MSEVYRGFWVVAYRELLRYARDRSRVLASLTFPLLFLAIFGAGFNNVIGDMAGGVNLIQFMYPGIIAMAVLTGSLATGILVVADRDTGSSRRSSSPR
jgi:ABC-2 type transport system permease protein